MKARVLTMIGCLAVLLAPSAATLPPGYVGRYSRNTWVWASLAISGQYPAGTAASVVAGTNVVVTVKAMGLWPESLNSLRPPPPAPTPTDWDRYQVQSVKVKIGSRESILPLDPGGMPSYNRDFGATVRIDSTKFPTPTQQQVELFVDVKLWRSSEPSDTTTVGIWVDWMMTPQNRLAVWGTAEKLEGQQCVVDLQSPYSLNSLIGADYAESGICGSNSEYVALLAGDQRARLRSPIISALETATGTFAFTHGSASDLRASRPDGQGLASMTFGEILFSTDRTARPGVPPPDFAILYACKTMSSPGTAKTAFNITGDNRFVLGFKEEVQSTLFNGIQGLASQAVKLTDYVLDGWTIKAAVVQVEGPDGFVAMFRNSNGVPTRCFISIEGDWYSRIAGAYMGSEQRGGGDLWCYIIDSGLLPR